MDKRCMEWIAEHVWPWSEINRLRGDCAEAYQVVGFCWAYVHFRQPNEPPPSEYAFECALDNLAAAASGYPRKHEHLLPWPNKMPLEIDEYEMP